MQINIKFNWLIQAAWKNNMKLQPIFNPHARIGQIAKKTKTEEKDELIATTKSAVLEKYAKKNAAKKAAATANMTGSG